jgi:hypothetical protein
MQPASKPRYNDSATVTPADPALSARDSYADHDVVADSDSVIFTNKRLIAINVHGLTGKNRVHNEIAEVGTT